MEVLTFLAVTAILVILIINNSSTSHRIKLLLKEIENLRHTIARLENKVSQPPAPPATSSTQPPKAETPVIRQEVPKPATSQPVASSYEDTVKAKTEAMNQKPTPPPASPKPAPEIISKPKQPTDFEKFIGENLISKLGIIILVLGIGFFVKYAIDQEWIGVYGRTAIGLITGGLLISLAHYLRKSYKTFSSLLTGGGFAIFYVTIAISYHQYHIFSKEAAFTIMVFITIFSVMLSLAYDKKELAIFSQLGGYAAPFMVSTGEGNYVILFSYVLILNTGLLILAYYKRWHILNFLAFIFTVILFSSWIIDTFWGGATPPYLHALLFASAFYLVFFLVNILNNLKERKPFKAEEIILILSNNLFFFLWGIAILFNYENGIYKGLFTIIAGIFNFGWVLFLFRKKQVDKNLVYLLIALVISYISLAVPIQLNGHSITLFWTAELVILLWLAQVTGIKILRIGHLVIFALVGISLLTDWVFIYGNSIKTLPVIVNKGFITGAFVVSGIAAVSFLLRREKDDNFVKHLVDAATYKKVITLFLFSAAFLVPFFEINYQMKLHYPSDSFRVVVAGVYVYAYLFIVLMISVFPRPKSYLNIIFILSWAALLLYPVVFHLNLLGLRHAYIFGKEITLGNFLFHYLAILFIAGIVLILFRKMKQVLSEEGVFKNLFYWFITILVVFIASTGLDNLILIFSDVNINNYNSLLKISHKVGYPILWGICAFILIALGIKYKTRIFRIQALSLFTLILLKLFLFDVWDMSKGGRIAAFIFLGVVLLIVSFLYQKLRNKLLDSANAASTPLNKEP